MIPNKTPHKALIRRLLALEAGLAMLGILISSSVYLYALGQQQRIAENLFQHPFAVSNAGVEFRSDVLEFRRYMLEVMVTRTHVGDTELATIRRLEEKMDRHLAIIRKEFLGDQSRVNNIIVEMAAWKKARESIKAQLLANKPDAALNIAMHQAKPHIEQILVDTEYVISFARSRALRFVEEGRAQLAQAKLLLIVLVGLSLVGYLLLSGKLRQEIQRIYDMEEHNATFDELSGSHNRRTFIKSVEIEIQRSLRHGLPLSLLMMDLDHFKNVNDTHGHDAGDIVLRQFGNICRQHLRASDLLGRMGGEEFAILLPQTALQDAINIAERIRQNVAVWDFKIDDDKFVKVTVSMGAAALDSSINNISALLKRADEAMYRSKTEGRNRVTSCYSMET